VGSRAQRKADPAKESERERMDPPIRDRRVSLLRRSGRRGPTSRGTASSKEKRCWWWLVAKEKNRSNEVDFSFEEGASLKPPSSFPLLYSSIPPTMSSINSAPTAAPTSSSKTSAAQTGPSSSGSVTKRSALDSLSSFLLLLFFIRFLINLEADSFLFSMGLIGSGCALSLWVSWYVFFFGRW